MSEDTTEVATALLRLYFDPSYYRRTYPDVVTAKVDHLWHYMTYGHLEDRDPTSWFSTRSYRSEQGLSPEKNPFLHFLRNNRQKADELSKAEDVPASAVQARPSKLRYLTQPYYSLRTPRLPGAEPVLFTCIAGTRHAIGINTTQHSDQRLFGDTPTAQPGWAFSPSLYWDDNPKLIALFHKYVMATLFPVGTKLIWVDSRVSLQREIISEIARLLDDSDLCLFSHYERNCVYDELVAIVKGQRATLEQCESFETYLKSISFPKYAGLFETGTVGFKVSEKVQRNMRKVFGLCKKFIPRDQVVLPVVLGNSDLKISVVNQGKSNLRNTPGVFLHPW